MRRPFLVLALLCFTALAFATNPPVAPISGQALNQFGQPLAYAQIWVCPVTSTGIPCSPTATIYQDYGLSIPIANPSSTDQYGNFLFYVPAYGYPNLYTIQISAGQGLYWTYVENGPATGGSGGGCTPTGSPYEILYQYPAVGDCPGDPDFLDYSANLGPLTFTGAGINATVVDNGTFTNGGSFIFNSTENSNRIIGGVLTNSSVDNGGSGYANGDTGYIAPGNAVYTVLSVNGSGAVLTYSISDSAPDYYTVSSGNETFVATGHGDGTLTFNILAATPWPQCPGCFIVNTTDNSTQGGGNFFVNATATNSTVYSGGQVNIVASSPNASSENDSGRGPGFVFIQSNSNAGVDGYIGQGSFVLDAEPYDDTSPGQSANMLLEACFNNAVVDAGGQSCNVNVSTRSYGTTQSGQFNVTTGENNFSGNPPVDPTEDSMNFIAYQGKSPINFTAAYISISSGLRSNSSSNTDLTGQVTLSGGTATQPLTGTYASAPNCWVIGDLTTPGFSALISASTTTLTFTGNASDVISYGCLGMN